MDITESHARSLRARKDGRVMNKPPGVKQSDRARLYSPSDAAWPEFNYDVTRFVFLPFCPGRAGERESGRKRRGMK